MLRTLPFPPQARIALLLLLWLAGLHGAWQLERRTTDRFLDRPLTGAVTLAATGVAQVLLPFDVERRGDAVLAAGHTAVLVRGGCNGVEALLLMLAGIFAVPAPWSVRLRALLVYLPALFALNTLRVLGLLWVMVTWPEHIGLFHDQVAQAVMIVAVLILWTRYLDRLGVSLRA